MHNISVSKVPAVTLGFWGIKILATTLGETGGDTLSMTLKLGYLVSSFVFVAALAIFVVAQISAKKFKAPLYWATILASTTAGTTIADFATRSLGVGYLGGSLLLFAGVIAALGAWRLVEGRIAADHVAGARTEMFYWLTITLSQTLGTALGDWMADDTGLGYLGAAAFFAGAIALVAAAYFLKRLPYALAFWAAFILTRPLGATVGDFLDKPFVEGGLALSRPLASLVLAGAIAALIAIIPQRAKGD